MQVLVDTNVLLRSAFGPAPQQAQALRAVGTLRARGDDLTICLQNLTEFWQNATKNRPANGYDPTAADANRRIGVILQQLTFLPDPPDTHLVWRRLVTTRNVRGTNVHDARLAATALAAGVADLLTFNQSDFVRFAADGLNPLDPATV